MERILKTIAKQANLDRVLFTPALKKLYFTMAMASGGATQFKHAESLRKGLSYAADKAGDNKHTLLFCSVHEIPDAYDMLLRFADELTPVIVLALRFGTDESGYAHWSFGQLGGTGCMQFHTHTRQDLYNHLALGYYLYEEKKVHLPILVIHSSPSHECLGEYIPKEDINLGNPLMGLQSSRATKKLDFDAALAAVRQKKEKPTLRKIYENLIPVLREVYSDVGYNLPEQGLPMAGQDSGEDWAVITLVPPRKKRTGFTGCSVTGHFLWRVFYPGSKIKNGFWLLNLSQRLARRFHPFMEKSAGFQIGLPDRVFLFVHQETMAHYLTNKQRKS